MRARLKPHPQARTPAESLRATMAAVRISSMLLGSLVGSTEANVRQTQRIVDGMAVTAAESVAKLRDWASGRCLSASVPGLYLRAREAGAMVGGRQVARGQVN
jgi:hypothetical protein